jgi:hypothetical protein
MNWREKNAKGRALELESAARIVPKLSAPYRSPRLDYATARPTLWLT